jgi:polyisoprenyl-teichoic acid--peptidoglycan teichoic acid transferase
VSHPAEPSPGSSAPLPPSLERGTRGVTSTVRPGRRWLLPIVVVMALVGTGVVGIGGYGYAHWRFGQIATVDLPGLHKPAAPGRPMVLLVVGSDARAGLHQPGDAASFGTTRDAAGQRADVIMLVRLDPASTTVKVLSVPRDLLVPIAGGGRNKVNAAFQRGPEQLVETIQRDLRIPINHYLLVNFDGFRAVVDALGGVRLDFPFPAADATAGLSIGHTGCQRLDGEQALALARARHYRYRQGGRWLADPLGDLGRIRRQQVLLRAMLDTAIARGLTNPLRANAFIGAVVGHLTRDRGLTVGEAVGLARQFHSFDPGRLQTTAPPTVAVNHYQGFGDVLLLKQPDARRVIARFLGRTTGRTAGAAGPGTTAPGAHRGGVSLAQTKSPQSLPTAARSFDPRPC